MALRAQIRLAAESALEHDLSQVYTRKSFSIDFDISRVLRDWIPVLDGRPIENILEIGSWEGRSAIALLHLCPEAAITCIDSFSGLNPIPDPPPPDYARSVAILESRFDANTAEFGNRIRKMKGQSVRQLSELILEGASFDLAYIDGSHTRDDTLVDSMLVWRMLKIGGIAIWDDRRWGMRRPPEQRPADALALFEGAFAGAYRVLRRRRQLIVEKTRAWPWRYTVPRRGLRRAAPIWLRRHLP